MDIDEELLDRFAKAIDLPAFMWQRGFRVSDERAPGQLRMTEPTTGESLVLERDSLRGWTFASPDRPTERGSIVDYLTRRDGASRGECFERLVACADERGLRSEEAARYRAVLRDRPDMLEAARKERDRARAAERAGHRVLERYGVPAGVIDEVRFGRIRSEEDAVKLTGDSTPLWASRYRPSDKAVVLVERPIDAIGYERTVGKGSACYIALGSEPDPERRKRLARMLAEIPAGVGVVLAFGSDRTGRKLAEEVQALAPTVRMDRQAPEFGGRWADQMQLEARHARSLQRLNRGPCR
jgi:hypothetical protein